jgi:hypothetical protein
MENHQDDSDLEAAFSQQSTVPRSLATHRSGQSDNIFNPNDSLYKTELDSISIDTGDVDQKGEKVGRKS